MSDIDKLTASYLSRRALLGVVGVSALALAGCQVRPLYSDQVSLAAPSQTASALSQIMIDPPADRLTQLVRNELVFGLNGGNSGATYRMAMRATSSTQSLGVAASGASFAQSVQVTANYQLFRNGDTEPLLERQAFSTASYDTSGQRFANQRAAIDAQDRAAKEVAAIIETQLAAAFATGL
ncbi:MAG: LPS assembly lipoprotein LptE [Devosiaceae bacterium]